MSSSTLPERASLEYLKKLAKDRLRDLRRTNPQAKLASALLAVARDHGFSSWRALKAEVDKRQSKTVGLFFVACAEGDVEALRGLLANDPSLVRASAPDSPYPGWTGLHEAAKRGHQDAVRWLLQHGADANAREAGDHTYPLHWAVAQGHLEIVRALLDAGGDAQGFGDVHLLDVIGWATVFHEGDNPKVLSLLLERGARHHVFSAIAAGDLALIQTLVEQNPEALDRRLSRFEQKQSPLHFAMSRKRYDVLDLLIELGADLEAEDMSGQTALAVAMLRGDREAMSRLHAAGAQPPRMIAPASFNTSMAKLGDSIKKAVPMIYVPDVAAALAWYASIGFKEIARYEDDGVVNFGMVSFGKAELMLNMHGKPGPHDVSLWFYTDQVDELYRLFKSRQLEAAQAAIEGRPGDQQGIEFAEDINDTFYGVREFGIRDLNGYVLYFEQPLER
ncbi:MAG: ankyrin repeat domain-containing protein [Thermoanaerobaculia bacterium]